MSSESTDNIMNHNMAWDNAQVTFSTAVEMVNNTVLIVYIVKYNSYLFSQSMFEFLVLLGK